MRHLASRTLITLIVATVALVLAPAVPASGAPRPADQGEFRGGGHGGGSDLPKQPAMTGSGGAVATVDRDASQVGIDVLRAGGNAADAAIATAAALGVTEPYSAGIGGGGFLVYYDARRRAVFTVDGRETAPASFTERTFLDSSGKPLVFADVVSSGLSVGVPGTPALWDKAARQFGTWPLRDLLRPAEQLAADGFVVDATFAQQTKDNETRFRKFPETARVFLPGGQLPVVGSTFRNPDLAAAYRTLRYRGVDELYRGDMGHALVQAARTPATAPGVTVYPGQITSRDLRQYRALTPAPTRSQYDGLDIYGMPTPSSGGIAVGESLNLIESYQGMTGQLLSAVDDVQYLHRFAEATATAFADRNRWVGDVRRVPTRELLSPGFADERACQFFDPMKAAARPIPFGEPDGRYSTAGCRPAVAPAPADKEEHGTTNLTVTDRWGNVAEYTLTIEQTGGSGITVPGYGFLLNNEMTDFNFQQADPNVPDPNLPGPGKRPRSSMSPTIVLDCGRPVLAVGSPGGATIITTVTQVLLGHLDRDLSLVDAIAAPRLSSRNGTIQAEPVIVDGDLGKGLTAMGHQLAGTPEIGAATAIRLLGDGRFVAAAETSRRGGGSAMVVSQR
ncbi:gamma-glutamyltransferase [Nakamurella sp.]|uniref:gamma-glutamyltransferase n=1 Tax=Nakamurella sp. TaxID=1869182 RepID=UPI0037851D48